MTRPSRREQASRAFERVKTEPGLARNTIVLIALIVIAAVVGGIILANQRFVAPWDDRQIFYAAFEATPGISPGNGQEVRIAGVNVGDIVDAKLDDNGQALLKLSIERGHHVFENARLVLRPKSPLNEMYITIAPGGPPAKEIGPDYVFQKSSTVRPVQVDEVLNHLDDNAQKALTSLLAESDVALTNAKTQLPAGLDATRVVGNNLKPVSEELAKRKETIRTLITALGQISAALGGDDKRVSTLAAALQTTLRSLASHDPQLDQSLAALPGLIHNLRRSTDAVQDLSDQLDPTLRNLQRASDEFPDALERLRDTSDRIDDVVDAADPFIDALRPVVEDLRPFVDDLNDALPELHAATRELDPLTNALVPYLPDLAAFTIQTRSVMGNDDANGSYARGFLKGTPRTAPAIFGPNNGVKPIPAPALDKGTTALQNAVPMGPGGQPPIPQDGSKPEKKNGGNPPGGDQGNPQRVLPPTGGNTQPPADEKKSDGVGGLLPLGGN